MEATRKEGYLIRLELPNSGPNHGRRTFVWKGSLGRVREVARILGDIYAYPIRKVLDARGREV